MKRQEMPPIIYGIETEVSAAVVPHPDAPGQPLDYITIATLLGYIGKEVLPGLGAVGESNRYLANAWRTYIDANNIMEFSAGESTTIAEAVTQDFAMDRTIYTLLAKGQEEGLYVDFAVGHRALHINRSASGALLGVTSIGRHQNFGFTRGKVDISQSALKTFGLQAALRPLLIGSGAVLLPDAMEDIKAEGETPSGDTVFSRSQKMPVIYRDYGGGTMFNRPLVNSRDTSYAAPDMVRVHDSSSEHMPSPWAKRMGLGMGALSLLLTHYEMDVPDHVLADVGELHVFGRALSFDMERPDSFASGEVTKQAIALSKVLTTLGRQLSEKVTLSSELLWTLDEWERGLRDFETDPRLLKDRTDWVAKKMTLTKFVEADSRRSWEDPSLEDKDRQWDNLGPKGFAARLRTRSWAHAMPDEAAIVQAQWQPVQTTRARPRGALIQAMHDLPYGTYANWQGVYLPEAGLKLSMDNPHWAGPDDIAGWVHRRSLDARLSRSALQYVYQEAKAEQRRTRNATRSRSRPRR